MMEIYIIDKYLGLSGPISGSDSSSPANKHPASVLLLLFGVAGCKCSRLDEEMSCYISKTNHKTRSLLQHVFVVW